MFLSIPGEDKSEGVTPSVFNFFAPQVVRNGSQPLTSLSSLKGQVLVQIKGYSFKGNGPQGMCSRHNVLLQPKFMDTYQNFLQSLRGTIATFRPMCAVQNNVGGFEGREDMSEEPQDIVFQIT